MATPISKKPTTILDAMFSPDALPPGHPDNTLPKPFSRFIPPCYLGCDFVIPVHPLMDKSDTIIMYFTHVMYPNGSLTSGQPTIEYPSPIPPSKTSTGLPIDPSSPFFHTIPFKGPLMSDPGYAARYIVKNTRTGQTWGYGKTAYFFIV
jgi:hypothetical protein